MKATATRESGFRHTVKIRSHELSVDERADMGGTDTGPEPLELLAASLASCTAVTMEMYAQRKGWDLSECEVAVDYQPAERGCPTRFELVLKLPADLPPEQAQRLTTIAAKCPVHRTLEGEVMFSERVEHVQAPARAA